MTNCDRLRFDSSIERKIQKKSNKEKEKIEKIVL